MAKSQAVREKFMELRARGMSYERISESINVSKTTLVKWGQQMEAQISELRGQELELMLERFRLTREYRVERFARMLDKIEVVVEKRELDTVQTDRLIRLYIRTMEAIRNEVEPSKLEVGVTVEESPLDRWERLMRDCVVPAATETVKAIAES